MAEGGGEEKQFIGKLLQKGTKYGTNSRLTQKSSVYIKHKIIKGDTLQGISLKYGTTVSVLRKICYFRKQMSNPDMNQNSL